ncbi:MAG: outer membrane beta-barrel protein [Parasphingorhabdus sp.]
MRKTTKLLALAAASSVAFSAAPALAKEGDVIVRVRAINVMPNEDSSSILPAFPGEDVSVNNSVMPEIDITYMATDNIGFELIAATTKHHASGKTGTTGTLGRLASTWVLPPTLTAQYHFAPESSVRPYIGAGVNYTIFYSEDASDALTNAVGPTTVSMDDSFGIAVQAGVDIDLSENLFLNLDVKYIDIDTTATFNTTAAGTQQVDIDLDPIVVGVGLGMRF